MNRIEAWCVHLSALLVAGTGLVYAVMRYALEPIDPYSIVNHPWQPTLQHAHIWTAPMLVFGAGLIWREHIWKHWRQGRKTGRRSGLTLLLTLAPMVLSGYLIQTTVSEGWRNAWVVVHLVTGGLFVVGYGAHVYARLARRRRREAAKRPAAIRQRPAEG